MFFDTFTRIAVPYFFFASALLLFRNYQPGREWYSRATCKRVRTLLVPYLVSNMVAFALYSAKALASDIVHGRPASSFVTGLLRRAWLVTGLDITRYPLVGSLWFVRNLFILVVLSPLVFLVVRRNRNIGFVALVIAFVLWASPLSNTVFFRIGFSLEGLFWFMAGAYCSRDLSRLGHPCKHATPLCWVFLVATLAFGIAGRAWFPKRFAFLGIAPGILAGLLSAFTFYDIIERHIRLVPGNQVLSTSSFLYLYQFVPLFIVSLLVGNLRLSFTRGATLTILLLWFMIAAVLVFSALAFKKSLPRTYSFVTGGR